MAELRPFGAEIWTAQAEAPVMVAGFAYPTRMAVIRLRDGGLLLWSPIALDAGLRAAVAELGPVRHLAAPNALHHLALGDWAEAFPQAALHAPPGLRRKRPDLAFDHDLGDARHPDWAGELDQAVMRGNMIAEEVVFFHAPSRAAIFADLIQHFPPDAFTGWRRAAARLDGMIGPEPGVPRKFRLAFLRRGPARAALARIHGWGAERVLFAHGAPVMRDGAAFLRRAFAWLEA